MKTQARLIDDLPAKLLASAVIVACLAIGIVGIVLPIIPGLLFLAIAVLVAARYFPSIDRRLRERHGMGRHLDRVDGVMALSFRRKLELGALLCVKCLLAAVATATRLAKGRSASESKTAHVAPQSQRE